jgi:hypothetical protein
MRDETKPSSFLPSSLILHPAKAEHPELERRNHMGHDARKERTFSEERKGDGHVYY